MDDLVTWLRAQLDEDEEEARDFNFCEWTADGDAVTAPAIAGPRDGTRIIGEGMPFALAEWVARHDPARVLREVEAKRRILDLHRRGESDECVVCDVGAQSCGCLGWGDYPCATLRLLALPHANRPGYRDEWAPES